MIQRRILDKKKFLPGFLLVCLVTVLVPLAVAADQGDVDTSFGTNGYVLTDVVGGSEESYGIVVDGSGRLVVGGFNTSVNPFSSYVVRYLADGSLDTSFGTNGITAPIEDFRTEDVALDSSGRILVAGQRDAKFGLARYTTDGVLDTSFGANGVVTTLVPPAEFGSDSPRSLIVDASNKIIVAGNCDTATSYVLCLTRYTPDGTLDTSFGTNGYVYTDLSGWGFYIVIDGSGNLLVTTSTVVDRLGVARFTPNGTLDNTFGTNGVAEIQLAESYDTVNAYSVVIDGLNNVIVGGHCYDNVNSWMANCVTRFTSGGILDTSFGTNGVSVTPQAGGAPLWIGDDSGRLLRAGSSCQDPGDGSNLCVSRYTADGILDTTFGVDGFAIIDLGDGVQATRDAVFDGLGNIILTGQCRDDGDDFGFCLAKFKNASTPGVPTDVIVIAGSSQVMVVWNAPNDDGDNAITEYTATASPGGATCTTATTSCTITGLTNGTAYTVTVFATNGQGDSEISPAYGPATPGVGDQPGYTG